jgi:glycosyltransferase involved in cell wall biosynthesis
MASLPASPPSIHLAGLDLFWLDSLYIALRKAHPTTLASTWTIKRRKPWQDAGAINLAPLHYALLAYKMSPALRRNGSVYLNLCRLFDRFASPTLPAQARVFGYLSGCGLHTARRARKQGARVVIECGSTHADFQHEIVSRELARNGITTPLFPEAYRLRVKQEFAEADFIHVPSEFVARTFIERGFPPEKLLVAPYGVDLRNFQPAEVPRADGPFRVICPSGVNLRKGARLLAEAWRRLGWKDAELHWIGQPGPETRPLFTPPLPGIVFHSYLPHQALAELYRSCDAFVLPSFEEGLARVMLEAAASGLPLIVTPNTGAETFFSPGNPEGWLIPTGDLDALCAALAEARANREACRSKGRAALERVRLFSWDAYGEKARVNYGRALA